jgi:hypothetical protein
MVGQTSKEAVVAEAEIVEHQEALAELQEEVLVEVDHPEETVVEELEDKFDLVG